MLAIVVAVRCVGSREILVLLLLLALEVVVALFDACFTLVSVVAGCHARLGGTLLAVIRVAVILYIYVIIDVV